MTIRPFLHLPPPGTFANFSDVTAYVRRLWDALFRMRQGKLEVTGDLTLTANAGSTVFNRNGISIQSFIGFQATTQNAATELAAGTMFTSAQSENTVTVTHANNAQADRIFRVLVIG